MRGLRLLLPTLLLLTGPAQGSRPTPRPKAPITKPTRPPIGTTTQAPRGAPGLAARSVALANGAFARPTTSRPSTPRPTGRIQGPVTLQRPTTTPGPTRPAGRPASRPASLTLAAPSVPSSRPSGPSPVRYPCCAVTAMARPTAVTIRPRGLPSSPSAILPSGGTTTYSFTRVDAAVKVER